MGAGRRHVLMVQVAAGKLPSPKNWKAVPEEDPVHVGFLLTKGWRICAVDSDVWGPEVPVDPSQSNVGRKKFRDEDHDDGA